VCVGLGQFRSGRSGQVRSDYVTLGRFGSDWVRLGQVGSGWVRFSRMVQVRSCQVGLGQVWFG
jgi:hypothetical protein